jgi:hypothetical protein
LEYQSRAEAAGIGDIDRQAQYALLTLFTSGKWIEHPTFVEFIKNATSFFLPISILTCKHFQKICGILVNCCGSQQHQVSEIWGLPGWRSAT